MNIVEIYGKVIFVMGISIGRNMTHNNILFKDASQIITYKIHYYAYFYIWVIVYPDILFQS